MRVDPLGRGRLRVPLATRGSPGGAARGDGLRPARSSGPDATGVADVVGDAGIVVPRDDPDALADALGALLADDERRAEPRPARAALACEEHFSLEAVGAQLRAFLVDRSDS